MAMIFSRPNSLKATFVALLAAVSLSAAPAAAQIQSVDPDTAIDGDLMGGNTAPPTTPAPYPADPQAQPTVDNSMPMENGTPVDSGMPADNSMPADNGMPANNAMPADSGAPVAAAAPAAQAADGTTYHEDDLIGAAEGVFGKGAQGLAQMIQDLLAKQGEPNGYIVGREGSGALVVGLRYGSGTLHHKVEGERPVYWTGPSIGFDAGANAGNAFVLVYNLYDSQDLYHRFVAGEGQAYFIGGFNVSYLRRGDVVLIPVRMGAGLRLGANVGYMKFSEKQRWLPF